MAKVTQQDLTQGNVSKQLIKYAIPMVATNIFQSLYSMVDIIIVGQYIGGSAISAVNNSTLIMSFLTQLAVGLTVGGNVLISQYYGSKNDEERKKSSGTLFVLSIILGLICSAGLYLGAESLLTLLGAPSLQEATTYLEICALGSIFIFCYNALAATLRAIGNSKTPFHFIAVSTTVNIVLDFVFVAILKMGVAGAAYATLIAQIISFALALIYVIKHKKDIGFSRYYNKLRLDIARLIIKFGIPVALQCTVASVSWLAVAFLINKYGIDVSAGNGVSNKIKEFCQLFIVALTNASATMAAQNLGAAQYERAKETMKTCMKYTLIVSFVIICIVQVFAPQLVGIFTSEPEVAVHAIKNLRIEIIAQVFYAGFLTYHSIASACGDTMFVMANSFLNCIIVRLVLAVFLEYQIGITGVYLACMIAPSVSVPVGHIYYKSNKWQKNITKA